MKRMLSFALLFVMFFSAASPLFADNNSLKAESILEFAKENLEKNNTRVLMLLLSTRTPM